MNFDKVFLKYTSCKEINLKSIHRTDSNGKRNIKIFLPLLCMCALIMACGKNSESEEVFVIDADYLGSTTTTFPPIPYPIELEDEFEIKVGELFGFENVNWEAIFPSSFSITAPEIVEGQETICELSTDSFSVLGKSFGDCSLKYPSENSGIEGFIFLTVKVVES